MATLVPSNVRDIVSSVYKVSWSFITPRRTGVPRGAIATRVTDIATLLGAIFVVSMCSPRAGLSSSVLLFEVCVWLVVRGLSGGCGIFAIWV